MIEISFRRPVGMGNILHSAAIVFVILAVITLVLAILCNSLPADLDTIPGPGES